MYVPKHFSVRGNAAALRLVEREPFGILVSQIDGKPFATHAPFVIAAREPDPVLALHIARANPQWENIDGAAVLAIFQGAHAHVSAAWYEEPQATVPTWDYAAVHCSGRARLVSAARTRAILEQLVRENEGHAGWSMETAETGYLERMQQGIVGIEIAVERIDAQFKYSQNRSEEDRRRVTEHLAASPNGEARRLFAEMSAFYEEGENGYVPEPPPA